MGELPRLRVAPVPRLTLARLASSMLEQTGELGVAKLRGEPWEEALSAAPRAFDSQDLIRVMPAEGAHRPPAA